MNKGTKIRTVLVVATCLNTALMATDFAQFNNVTVDLVYRIVSVILNFIIVSCATWFNNDYSIEACQGTAITRQLKAEQQEDYIGEYFFAQEETEIEAEKESEEDE